MTAICAPLAGTLEAWAFELITSGDLERKLSPPRPPVRLETEPVARRMLAPSRPAPLRVVERTLRSARRGAAGHPEGRARLLHTFLHHELQAAELFAWALLAFPVAPEEFRRGLVQLVLDELRHARLLRTQVERLGSSYGAFPVRDWFWERTVACESPAAFCALMGLGFEGGNLDHCAAWATRFRAAGDEESALVQELIGREEIGHVAFAARWFRELAGGLDFERWREALPHPVTPTLLRGKQLDLAARRAAGLSEQFLEELSVWDSASPGS
jgi:uncharacterized ferritin-like protein (DUF455 family)